MKVSKLKEMLSAMDDDANVLCDLWVYGDFPDGLSKAQKDLAILMVEKNYDANVGINWPVIEKACSGYDGPRYQFINRMEAHFLTGLPAIDYAYLLDTLSKEVASHEPPVIVNSLAGLIHYNKPFYLTKEGNYFKAWRLL